MSATLYFEEDKDPTDADYYAVEVEEAWLGLEVINSTLFEAEEGSGLVVSNIGFQDREVRALISAGNIGTHKVTITVTTDTGRVRQRSVFLVVKEK